MSYLYLNSWSRKMQISVIGGRLLNKIATQMSKRTSITLYINTDMREKMDIWGKTTFDCHKKG